MNKNKQVIKLIDEWRNDLSDFEDVTWPIGKIIYPKKNDDIMKDGMKLWNRELIELKKLLKK